MGLLGGCASYSHSFELLRVIHTGCRWCGYTRHVPGIHGFGLGAPPYFPNPGPQVRHKKVVVFQRIFTRCKDYLVVDALSSDMSYLECLYVCQCTHTSSIDAPAYVEYASFPGIPKMALITILWGMGHSASGGVKYSTVHRGHHSCRRGMALNGRDVN
jgi:hypothetical protein